MSRALLDQPVYRASKDHPELLAPRVLMEQWARLGLRETTDPRVSRARPAQPDPLALGVIRDHLELRVLLDQPVHRVIRGHLV